MKVHIISKETIKPSSPTSPHLKTYKLSLLDQLSSRFYISRVLFYTSNASDNTSYKVSHLKKCLSETLALYYPFTGRLRDGVCIDCNDDGVELFEAKISCRLSEILKKPTPETLHGLFPSDLLGNNSYKGSLVVIQINYFDCGGMAVSVCVSHKVADGCTMSNFISDWAAMARQDGVPSHPMFIAATSRSPLDNPFDMPEIELKKQSCITRRFVFDSPKIAKLKSMAADPRAQNPTRVEVVTALLFKSAMASMSRKNPSLLIQTMNMRPKMSPPLPPNSAGNFCWHFTLSLNGDQRDTKLHELVTQMRKCMTQFHDKKVRNFTVNEWFVTVRESLKEAKALYDSKTEINVFSSNSMCRFPFYKVDFGWGNPVWVAIAGNVFKNTFVLMDSPCSDGIEAWVTLDEQDMEVFGNDEGILRFSSLNPSVLDTDREVIKNSSARDTSGSTMRICWPKIRPTISI
ncbi:unnamed protein product [Camellia sinensis]